MLCSILLGVAAVASHALADDSAFDYIILGGGTAGLVVANRLSADPKTTVLVVEPGESVYNNPNVTQINNYFQSLGTSIDWQYPSQTQKYTKDRTIVYSQGKALGGTSTINGATYVRAQKAQIDAWSTLGNPGWNWSSLWPYYLKSEHFQTPTPELIAKGAAYDSAYHGRDGLLFVGFGNNTSGGEVHSLVNQTWQNIGIPYSPDQSGGDVRGFSVWPSTINSQLSIRADAARSYYWPIASRKNLHVYTGTLAEKIIWQNSYGSSQDNLTATGVQIRAIGGVQSRTVRATKEVILSAGTLKSPVILEQSGVGNPAILAKHNIPMKINLPSVGENLQDQPNTIIQANTTSNQSTWAGYTPYIANLLATDLFGANTSKIASSINAKIPSYARTIANATNNAIPASTVEKHLQLQWNLIFKQSTPLAEIITLLEPTTVITAFWPLLPFSRGNVHLSSTNASSVPLINPNFFMLDWDVEVAAAMGNEIRRFLRTKPIDKSIGAEVAPGEKMVPKGSGTEGWEAWLKEKYSSNSHPLGTCAMMARDMGGVVSPELKVYGTNNVRVVDASVLPYQIDGHLTATLYAVAERAADIILGKIQ